MFALRKAELPQYLQILASNQEGCSVATSDQSGLMDNLKDLLIFWQDHYLQKDKDCTILERVSFLILFVVIFCEDNFKGLSKEGLWI